MNHADNSPSFTPYDVITFVLRCAPRTIVAGFAGYYSLGIAYDQGVMAAIDRVAIRVFKHTLGYAGLGAVMPTFQWYSAWGVRIVAALAAGLLYDLSERMLLIIFRTIRTNLCCSPKPNLASPKTFLV